MIAFFVLTYALAWTLWFLAGLGSPGGPNRPLFLLGVFSPGIVAIALTAVAGGGSAVTALLRRLVDWNVALRWYVFAAGFMLAIKLTAAVVHRLLWDTWPAFGPVPLPLMLAAAFVSTMTGGQAGEELGWRGYALPRLADRFGMGIASVVLGVIWAAWHVPLFLVPGGDTFGQSFPVYTLQVTALSVTMAWLYANTRGSLLPVMLLHAAVNNTKDIVPSLDAGATDPWALSQSPVAWITVGLMWICAACFLWHLTAAIGGIDSRRGRAAPAQFHRRSMGAIRRH